MSNVSSSNGLEKRPKLRFTGFDEPWSEIKIGDIFKVTRGNVLSTALVSSVKSDRYAYPVFSSQTKDDGLMGYYDDSLFEDAITWTTDGANAGTVHFRKGKFYCTNVCGVLLNPYGYANRCTAEILGRVSKRYVSYVGNPKLMNNVMSEIRIYIPSLVEQTHIDNFLLTLDKKIEKQRHLVDLLKKYKRGLIKALISRSVTFSDANCKSWETVSLAEIFSISAGGDIDRKNSSPSHSPNYPYPVYANALTNKGLYGYANYFKVDGDSITVSGRGEVGHAIARHCKYVPIVRLLSLVPKYGDDVDFFAYMINATSIFIESTGVPQLTSPQLGAVKVLRPPISEQKRLSSLLLKIDAKIESEECLMLHLSKIRTSMLQQLFI